MDFRISHGDIDTSIDVIMSTSINVFDDDTPDFMEKPGDRIAQRRNELGWSQDRLATEVRRLGGKLVGKSVSNIEKNRRERIAGMDKIAAALGVTIAWIETGAEPKLAEDAAGAQAGIQPSVLVQTIVDVLTLIRDDRSFNRKLTDDEIRGLAIAIQTKASRAELKLESTQDLTAYIDLARQARVLP